jgi:hypothetical protein
MVGSPARVHAYVGADGARSATPAITDSCRPITGTGPTLKGVSANEKGPLSPSDVDVCLGSL